LKVKLSAYPCNTALLYRRFWTEAGLVTVRSLLEQTEDVTIAITARRWRAWEIRSAFFFIVQETGILLDAAQRAGSSLEGRVGAPRRNASPTSKEVISRQTPRTNPQRRDRSLVAFDPLFRG
jgi:hypothetical protein